MDTKLVREIIHKNLSLCFTVPMLLSVIILIFATVLFPTAALSRQEACSPLEKIIPLVGTIMMTSVFLPEQDSCIFNIIASKKIDIRKIILLRFVISLILVLLMVGSFCFYMDWNECNITLYIIFGGFASAFFVGSIGFMVSAFTGNVMNGNMAAIIYYIANYGLKKQLGLFYLFRMSMGQFVGKGWLIAVGTLFCILGYGRLYVKRNIR